MHPSKRQLKNETGSTQDKGPPAQPKSCARWRRPLVAGSLALALAASALAADWYFSLPEDAEARYVGRDQCAQCHQQEHQAWTGSHHDLAMQLADEETVLGDFDDSEFTYQGVTTRFFRRDGRFYAHAEGPDGKHRDYHVKYTFGVDPLQQYMIEFPDGRVQVLRTSWDTHKKEWFYVPPPDARDQRILPDDPMHWTGPAQNWNHTCAECHSTNYHKNYDLESDTYHASYSEIDVSCEACHGPGSLHVDLAESFSPFWDRRHGYGLVKLKGSDPTNELSTCATCHARRGAVHPDFRPGRNFLDHYDLTLLLPGLYHVDGQIQDEVYVYGSFLQSKMHANGVRCTDCHNPHSLKLKFSGNAVCTNCHQHPVAKYDTPAHHHHPVGSAGAACVGCHMPDEVYMEVDPRRDHSFRIPRPDLTVQLGTPNACNGCHTDEEQTPEWAAGKLQEWYGPERAATKHFAPAFAAATQGDDRGERALVEVADPRQGWSAVVRATAITLLGGYGGEASRRAQLAALEDDEALVRIAALRSLPGVQGITRKTFRLVVDLLTDPVRGVRMAAARQLAPLLAGPTQNSGLNSEARDALHAALEEYREAQRIALDRAASHLNLGDLAERLGDWSTAAAEYRLASQVEPYFTGPRALLANVLEQQQRAAPGTSASAARTGQLAAQIKQLREKELELLARDVVLVPDSGELRYRYATMLFLMGDLQASLGQVREACRLRPTSYQYRLFLALLYERLGQLDKALESLDVLEQLQPGSREVEALRARMQAAKS